MLCALAMVLLLLALHTFVVGVVVVTHISHIVGVAITLVHTSCMPSVGILHISLCFAHDHCCIVFEFYSFQFSLSFAIYVSVFV
jgi:hypothetical protein